MLAGVPEQEQLSMHEIFEIFAKHKADPDVYTASALAQEYRTRA